jgi:hypothetical protein
MVITPELLRSYLGGKIFVTNWAAAGSPGKTKKMNITGEMFRFLAMSAGTPHAKTPASKTISNR